MTGARLLLLAPSIGFGGGIERVARAMQLAWEGPVDRVNLYRKEQHAVPAGHPWAKAMFAAEALVAARRRPDVVLALHVGLLPVAAVAAGFTHADLALMAIGEEVWAPMRASRRAMVQRCARVLAISSFTRSWIVRRAEIDPRRVSVIDLPVDEALARRAFVAPPQVGRRCNLVTVSRINRDERYKGHFEVAESLPRVLARQPTARWIVVGDGDDVDALRARCQELGISEAVSFLGHVSDERLADLYADATIFVLPSVANAEAPSPRGEGFGLVYVEAGAFGIPSIASAAGGGSLDFVIHERTGLTVRPADPEALATAMLRLLEDEDLRARLGSAARVRVKERHLMPHFAASVHSALCGPPTES
jgi:phosphatidylinositol alpha-1,6-mannosyltransferase